MNKNDVGDATQVLEARAAREGDGFHHAGLLQWVLTCPHMGAADKILLGTLGSLVKSEHGNRRNVTLNEMCTILSASPVEIGEDRRRLSLSGVRKQIKNLSKLGQITTLEGDPVTTSSRADATLRVVVHLYPRHQCSGYRNVRDALAAVREEEVWYPLADGSDPGHQSDQGPELGYFSSHAGYFSDQAGYKSNHAGHFCAPPKGPDQQERTPSKTSSKTSPISLSNTSRAREPVGPAGPGERDSAAPHKPAKAGASRTRTAGSRARVETSRSRTTKITTSDLPSAVSSPSGARRRAKPGKSPRDSSEDVVAALEALDGRIERDLAEELAQEIPPSWTGDALRRYWRGRYSPKKVGVPDLVIRKLIGRLPDDPPSESKATTERRRPVVNDHDCPSCNGTRHLEDERGMLMGVRCFNPGHDGERWTPRDVYLSEVRAEMEAAKG